MLYHHNTLFINVWYLSGSPFHFFFARLWRIKRGSCGLLHVFYFTSDVNRELKKLSHPTYHSQRAIKRWLCTIKQWRRKLMSRFCAGLFVVHRSATVLCWCCFYVQQQQQQWVVVSSIRRVSSIFYEESSRCLLLLWWCAANYYRLLSMFVSGLQHVLLYESAFGVSVMMTCAIGYGEYLAAQRFRVSLSEVGD